MKHELLKILNPFVVGTWTSNIPQIRENLMTFINKKDNQKFTHDIIKSMNQLNAMHIDFMDKTCLEKLSQLHFDLAEKFERASKGTTINHDLIKRLITQLDAFDDLSKKENEIKNIFDTFSTMKSNIKLLNSEIIDPITQIITVSNRQFNYISKAKEDLIIKITHNVAKLLR